MYPGSGCSCTSSLHPMPHAQETLGKREGEADAQAAELAQARSPARRRPRPRRRRGPVSGGRRRAQSRWWANVWSDAAAAASHSAGHAGDAIGSVFVSPAAATRRSTRNTPVVVQRRRCPSTAPRTASTPSPRARRRRRTPAATGVARAIRDVRPPPGGSRSSGGRLRLRIDRCRPTHCRWRWLQWRARGNGTPPTPLTASTCPLNARRPHRAAADDDARHALGGPVGGATALAAGVVERPVGRAHAAEVVAVERDVQPRRGGIPRERRNGNPTAPATVCVHLDHRRPHPVVQWPDMIMLVGESNVDRVVRRRSFCSPAHGCANAYVRAPARWRRPRGLSLKLAARAGLGAANLANGSHRRSVRLAPGVRGRRPPGRVRVAGRGRARRGGGSPGRHSAPRKAAPSVPRSRPPSAHQCSSRSRRRATRRRS